ncbi:hypothetical protein KC19_VG128400 [Ceratodon purpureus]|uniref:Uncharacterized protein n=1 Tax=Ceratodon purpureus TaxID=3225 RepID=A0A8T0HQ12_CERPU|nr:hypothetical protein KC19_VG128400 [Ceratodon purpureus]KAG0572826.1 hypothetical protein KC19_VG128400 [Ceratodon purpureus]KAG0572827.1 hypothetical protein KC19_VG128400 [Ceratodon purpureus]KAG0572830.1 hypothetical protein KC19_VG128400 [Ceratodon purpureus]KAG0572834.1 hypothetical protein KC19_VG128400 [Ceratodon purpureus]
MSNCFEVLARSAIVSAKREGCDQLGQGYISPLHNIKLEWSSGMSSPCDVGHDLNPFQFQYMGDGLNGRRGLNQHHQHYHSKQLNQGGAFVSASEVMKETTDVSTESSVVYNAWGSHDGGGTLLENRRINLLKSVEEQWWVDVLASRSMVIPSTLFQQENIACVEFGVPRHQVEDPRCMALTHSEDSAIVKWLSGDGQIHGQSEIQRAQTTGDMDNVMFEQDLLSSNQTQFGQHLGDDLLSSHGLHDLNYRETFSSHLSSSISHPPASCEPKSDSKFLHDHTSLPRAFTFPSPVHDISLNLANHTGVSASMIATPFLNMDEPGGPSVSATAPVVGATRFSPDAFSTAEYYAQYFLFGNSTSEGQLSYRNTNAVHQTSLLVDEGPAVLRGILPTSPSSVHSLCPNMSSFTSAYFHQEIDKLFEERSPLQPVISSLAIADSPSQQILIPPAMSGEYPISPQLSWNLEKMPFQLHQSCQENGSPKVNCAWKADTLQDCVGGAFSPLPSASSFSLSSNHTGLSAYYIGDDRKHEDAKLDTGQMEGGVIPEGGLTIVHLLLRAAEAVDIGNVDMAKAILARLNQHISPNREKSIHRVAHYFCEALVTRIIGVENLTTQLFQNRTLSSIEEFHRINAYVRFCEVSPYPKFAHFTANQAILEVLEGEEAMHVIDFQMGAGAQWASFLQDIASLRTAGKLVPTIRLTAVGTRADEIHVTGANLCNFARMLNISLEFQAVVTRPECLDVSMLGLRDNEAVAGNFIFSLHELLDGETSDGLSAVLKSVLDARPRVVTTVEQEANHSSTSFQQRFSEALQYYVFLFDSLTSSLQAGADSSANSGIESYLLAPEIMNIVACDGVSRVERHERLEQWRERMLAAGFSPRPLSDASLFQAEKLVSQISARHGFQVSRDQGGLLLGWQGRPLLAASSWIC